MNHRQLVEQQIVEKAMKDAEFRKELYRNPRATLQEELGIEIPDSVKITILEENAQQFYLVLPVESSAGESSELSEEELKNVAGGGQKLYTTGPEYCNWWNHGS